MSKRPREVVVVGPTFGSDQVISEIRAAIVLLDDGDEGIPIVEHPGEETVFAPLLATDEDRFEWLVRRARDHAKKSGKPVRIVRFTKTAELEVFHPDGRRSRVE